jgi:acyl-CoA synthetase (AMP-forming)/AMP-acid ligase II
MNIGIGILSLIVIKSLGKLGGNILVTCLILGGISAVFVPTEKFDVRKEMKKVYKGDWQPNNDNKEKSWFQKGLDNVLSSIQSEATIAFETKSLIERNFIIFKLITLTLNNGEEFHCGSCGEVGAISFGVSMDISRSSTSTP